MTVTWTRHALSRAKERGVKESASKHISPDLLSDFAERGMSELRLTVKGLIFVLKRTCTEWVIVTVFPK